MREAEEVDTWFKRSPRCLKTPVPVYLFYFLSLDLLSARPLQPWPSFPFPSLTKSEKAPDPEENKWRGKPMIFEGSLKY